MDGTTLNIIQTTNFPQDGRIDIAVNPEKDKKFKLKIRIPGWSEEEAIPGNLYMFNKPLKEKVSFSLNGKPISPERDNGYAIIINKWKKGDIVHFELPMDVRILTADPRVTQDNERVAIQRGPFVYCAEWPDNFNNQVLDLKFDTSAVYSAISDTMLNGVTIIKTKAAAVKRKQDGQLEMTENLDATLIPYYAWANRGHGEMMVWLPISLNTVKPLP
jgi:DUF1680 family protein